MASQSNGNLKNKIYIYALWVWGVLKFFASNVKLFVSDVKCMSLFHMCYAWVAWVSFWNVPYLRSENNLRRFVFLHHRRFNWCKKVQFLSVTLTDSFVQIIIDNLFTISCSFFVSVIGLFEKEVHQYELVRIENFSSWRKKAWCCQWVVNQQWRVCEPKVKKFWKSQGSSESSFSTKLKSRAEAKLGKQKSLLERSASFKR